MSQEYPKALYKSLRQADFKIADDKDHEAALREEGFTDYSELYEEAGSPVNITSELLDDQEAKSLSDDDKGSKTLLIEEAKSLGISANKTWGVEKIQEAINKAKAG